MTCKIRCAGLVGTTVVGQVGVPVGQYLKHYDPEAHEGRGFATWTDEEDQALEFADATEAFEFYNQVPPNRPVREDGQPNRPLTAFSVEIL